MSRETLRTIAVVHQGLSLQVEQSFVLALALGPPQGLTPLERDFDLQARPQGALLRRGRCAEQVACFVLQLAHAEEVSEADTAGKHRAGTELLFVEATGSVEVLDLAIDLEAR